VPDASFDPRFWDEIARREAREPLQHITGHAYFRYLDLAVGPGVFVPRQETELMTGWAIDRLREMDVAEPLVVDLGTGSGAIALAISQEVPRARVHAVEADPLARQWAERNIARCAAAAPHTAGRVSLHSGDFRRAAGEFCRPLGDLDSAADLVISNPPYIPPTRVGAPEVGEYDPATALWGGADGSTRSRRSRPSRAGCCAPGAAGRRAWRAAGQRGLLDLPGGARLAGDPQPQGSGRLGPVRHVRASVTRLASDGAAWPGAGSGGFRGRMGGHEPTV
jgi:release factor glutamine methyltransferase